MAQVLLGVTGSVAAIKTPELYAALRSAGHEVRIVATNAALYFFDATAIDGIPGDPPGRNPEVVSLDEDEWRGKDQGWLWQRQSPVLHIELRRWADVLLIAPLDANTLAKLAGGLCDNCLTCVYRAWDTTRPVVLAPAMNTLMWEHRLTGQQLRQMATLAGAVPPADVTLDALPEWISGHCAGLRVLTPETKQLACGDVGVGAMASIERIVAAVASAR